MPIVNPYAGYLDAGTGGAGANPYGGYISMLQRQRQQGDQQTMATAMAQLRKMIAAMPGTVQRPPVETMGYLPPKPALDDVYSPDDYDKGVTGIESGGDYKAYNPGSGAGGRYQFIPSTWSDLSKQRPELGLTDEGRMADTDDGKRQQQAAFRALTQQNAQSHKASLGRAPTHAELYLAHLLGPGYASSVLQNRETPVETLVPADFVKGNPMLKGVDGRTLLQMLARKFNP